MLGSSVGLSAVSFTSLRDKKIPFKNNSNHNKLRQTVIVTSSWLKWQQTFKQIPLYSFILLKSAVNIISIIFTHFFFLLWAIAPLEVFTSWFQVQAQCFKLAGHISDLARKVVLHLESSLSETSEGYPGAQQKGGGPCLMVALKFCLFLVSRFPLPLDRTWGSHSFPPH